MNNAHASEVDAALSMTMATWSNGIAHEITFWRNWLAARGGQWHWDFESRLDPEHPAEGFIAELLTGIQGCPSVLDVGAGPLTVVGKTYLGERINLQATDALADFYKELVTDAGISPPVPTQFSTAEDLSLFVKDSSFDVVYCQNALDHSFDPMRAISEMLRVVKVGGKIGLLHHENEAENENYIGFHQFNFSKSGEDFLIWNKALSINVANSLPVDATILTEIIDGNIAVTITKKSEFEDQVDGSRHRMRAAQLLRSLVAHYGKPAMDATQG